MKSESGPVPITIFRTMRILALISCLLPLTAHAEKQPGRTCRILFLEGPASAPQKLFLYDGVTCQEVELPRMNFSKVYDIAPGAVTLRLLPAPVTKPEQVNPQAPAASVPETLTDCYLILFSAPTNTVAPLRIQVVDAGADKFKPGQMLWFNLTKDNISGNIGSQRLAMSGISRVILNAPATTSVDYPVQIEYTTPEDPRHRPVCETRWRHDPRSRSVLFIYNQGGRAYPRVLGFPDYRPPAPKKEGAP